LAILNADILSLLRLIELSFSLNFCFLAA